MHDDVDCFKSCFLEAIRTQTYPHQVDCAWFAADRNGYLGIFTTAGDGAIPRVAYACTHVPFDQLEERLKSLDIVSDVEWIEGAPRTYTLSCWLASRGIFEFDWCPIFPASKRKLGLYLPITVPGQPRHLDQLPPDLRAVAQVVQLHDLDFRKPPEPGLDILLHADCIEP